MVCPVQGINVMKVRMKGGRNRDMRVAGVWLGQDQGSF